MHAPLATAHFEALCGHYQLHFVDRPRLDRSLAMLTQLRADMDALARGQGDADAAPDAALRDRARAQATAWAEEAAAIEAAQTSADEPARRRHVALQDWQRLQWRLRRLHRLHPQAQHALVHAWAALGDELAPVAAALQAQGLTEQADQAAHLAGHVAVQLAGARAAHASGAPAQQAQVAVLAARAALSDLAHAVVGRSLVGVRPSFVERCVHELRDAAAGLRRAGEAGAAQEADAEAHRHNCAALDAQVHDWQQQLRQIVSKRRQYTADELAHVLGEEADAVMQEAAEVHAQPQPQQAQAYLALRMDELHRQLQGVPLVFGHAQHRETLAGLADCLAYLERGLAHG